MIASVFSQNNKQFIQRTFATFLLRLIGGTLMAHIFIPKHMRKIITEAY